MWKLILLALAYRAFPPCNVLSHHEKTIKKPLKRHQLLLPCLPLLPINITHHISTFHSKPLYTLFLQKISSAQISPNPTWVLFLTHFSHLGHPHFPHHDHRLGPLPRSNRRGSTLRGHGSSLRLSQMVEDLHTGPVLRDQQICCSLCCPLAVFSFHFY